MQYADSVKHFKLTVYENKIQKIIPAVEEESGSRRLISSHNSEIEDKGCHSVLPSDHKSVFSDRYPFKKCSEK